MKTKLDQFQENIHRLYEIASKYDSRETSCGVSRVFKIEGGEARAWVLHERDSVTISKWHLSPRSTFPMHVHGSIEVITVFEGSATYVSGEFERELKPGDAIRIEKEKPHKMRAGEEGAWLSITLVPREEGVN